MAKFLIQVGYTPEAWAAMSREPQNIIDRVRPSAEVLGGSIDSLYFCFGDYDLVRCRRVLRRPLSRRLVRGSEQRRRSALLQNDNAADGRGRSARP